MASPAIYLGDFFVQRTRLIGSIEPEQDGGELLRTLWVCSDPLNGDPANHWVLSIGRYATGEFKADRAFAFPQGFPGGPVRVDLTPKSGFPEETCSP